MVLLGDAAGYENPLQGQGLSFAMRDVRELSELLLGSQGWTVGLLDDFGARRGRLRRVAKIATELDLWMNDGFHVQDPDVRADRFARAARDEVLQTLVDSAFVGFDSLPEDLSAAEVTARLESA